MAVELLLPIIWLVFGVRTAGDRGGVDALKRKIGRNLFAHIIVVVDVTSKHINFFRHAFLVA